MRKSGLLAIVVLTVSAFSGCDAFFEMNLFEAFEKIGIIPTSAEIKTMTATEIETLSGSDLFFEELANNDGATLDFINRLQDIQNDPTASGTDRQTAALIESEIYLETTPAGDAVDNLIDFLAGGSSGSSDLSNFTADSLSAFIEAIVPPAALTDKASFVEMIEAFEACYTPLMNYGSLITDPNAVPAVDSANPGEIAMNALLCSMISAVEPTDGKSTAETLWLILNDDPAVVMPVFDSATVTENPNLNNILAQAGLDSLIPETP